MVTGLIGGRVNPKDCATFEAGLEVCATEPSIDAYMRKNLLQPFGMISSGYLWDETTSLNVARGHDQKGKPYPGNLRPTGPVVARYGMLGGLNTTPFDYARFLVEIIEPRPFDAFRISKASSNEMLRPQVKRNDKSSWSLGWEINHTNDGDFIRHGGNNPGFNCFAAASPVKKSGYVIMTNSENGYELITKLGRRGGVVAIPWKQA